MNNLKLRQADHRDLPEIIVIIDLARKAMKAHGSGQWQDGTPTAQTIANDINNQQFFVATLNKHIVGCMALLDYEEGYDVLLEGAFIHHDKYKVIHRFATHQDFVNNGIAGFMLEEAELIAKAKAVNLIRIDTHQKNIPMMRLLDKHGYVNCGKTLIEKNKLRVVFEKAI